MGFVHLFLFTSVLVLFETVCGNAEVKVLMDMKSALDPENQFLSSWTNNGDPCNGSFEGVACNQFGKIANISLQGKGLSGSVPPSVSGLESLSGLYLHYNSLTGEIPREISNLTNLTDLYLNVNNLSGNIPIEIGNMASLQVLQLCYNQLSGSIPTQLGFLKKLSVLALQCNRLTGAIPASLGDLGMLTRLDLSFNQLFGSIPGKLSSVPNLEVLDVRNNTLSGNVLSALKRLNGGFQYGNNMGLCGDGFSSLRACESWDALNPNRPEPYGPESTGISSKEIPQSANIGIHCNKTHCPNSSKSPAIAVVVGVISVVAGGMVTGLLALTWYRRRKQKIGSAFELSDSRLSTDQAKDFCRKSASPLISLEYSNGWDPLADGRSGVGFSQVILQSFRFNLEEVESATQYFSEVNLLGKSNFSAVYRGILRDGSVVAVKSINKTSCQSEEAEFLKGLQILTSLRHENLVRLRGFCCSRGRGECFLIYDFVANGSLLQYLDVKGDKDRVLDWSTRVSIINGIAKGIEYLHGNKSNKPGLVHQSLSAEKVLIDQHCNPLLSDSGLHKLLADDVVFSTLKASAAMGYLAPEYTTIGRFTEKSDVYAFGVILFQVLSGKRRITHSMRLGAESGKFEDIIDENLQGKFSEPEGLKLAKMALVCTNEAPNLRPTMEVVIQELSKRTSNC
ncbi:protein NSP-INTERACTING KINASE 2-like [Tasmannia lanceolata]|uniref:protein NSP-INTERACTING KINASE 2-like n=1 Tax=Tasmannia lanceolata TaxID=3420 RepID=UPI0040631F31